MTIEQESIAKEQISVAQRVINEIPIIPDPLRDCLQVAGGIIRKVADERLILDLTQETIQPSDVERLPQQWQESIRLNGGIRLLSDSYGNVAQQPLPKNGKI